MILRKVKNFPPEQNSLGGASDHFLKSFLWKGMFHLIFKKPDVGLHLLLHISESMFPKVIMDKWGVKKEKRNFKVSSLNLIPLDHGSADIVPHIKKSGLGSGPRGPLPVKEDPISVSA